MLDGNGQINPKEYYKVLHKASQSVTRQKFRMIESQRISKYSRTDESMIPAIDSFQIGDYRTINAGYRYIIRNNGEDSFEIVGKQKIRAAEHLKGENSHVVGQLDKGNSSTAERTGSGLGYNRDGNLVSADGGALQENDRYLKENGTPEQRISPYEDTSDSGWGHLKNSLRNTEGVSNRSLPANALESAAQNDIERKKLTEYKGKGNTAQHCLRRFANLFRRLRVIKPFQTQSMAAALFLDSTKNLSQIIRAKSYGITQNQGYGRRILPIHLYIYTLPMQRFFDIIQ